MSMEYEWVDGYENGTYTDDMIFEVDKDTKQLQVITNQVMVSGENKSQFIRFQMPRYYDGIDLSTKNIQIIYITESGYSDINTAICVERNDESLRFGWLVPAAASYDVGTLSFGIEFVGDDYVLKTRVVDVEVFDGLNGGEIIPEPEEKTWYIELQQRCDYVLNQANAAKEAAAGSATNAAGSEGNALNYMTRAETAATGAESSETNAAASEGNALNYMTRAETAATGAESSETNAAASEGNALNYMTRAETAATGAESSETNAAASEGNALNYMTRAETAATGAESSETNAAASEAAAQTYAEQAAAVFQVAGTASFVIGSDNGVTMIFTKED